MQLTSRIAWNETFDWQTDGRSGLYTRPIYTSSYDVVVSNVSTNATMMTSPNGNIFRVTGPLCGEFTGPVEFPTQRPVTRSFDVFFDLRLNKRLSKQPGGWWFEMPSWSLWRHRNAIRRIRVIECEYITTCFGTNIQHFNGQHGWLD